MVTREQLMGVNLGGGPFGQVLNLSQAGFWELTSIADRVGAWWIAVKLPGGWRVLVLGMPIPLPGAFQHERHTSTGVIEVLLKDPSCRLSRGLARLLGIGGQERMDGPPASAGASRRAVGRPQRRGVPGAF
jgi:hypothetical protein